MSIRSKLFLLFSIVIGMGAALAVYGVHSLSTAGNFVVRLYDGPLMAINHARSAHASLNEARALMQRGLILREGAPLDTPKKLEEVVSYALEDLKIVRERVTDDAVLEALTRAEMALRDWFALGMSVLRPPPGGLTLLPMTSAVGGKGEIAAAALDELVQLTAAHGFDFRQQAEANVTAARLTMISFTVVTGIIGVLLALGFAYSLVRPIRTAMGIAERVAAGNFSDKIEVRGRDELSRLLRSLAAMQASLKAKVDEELARREQEEQARADQADLKRTIMAELAGSFEVKVGGLTHTLEAAATEVEATARSMSATAEQTSQRAIIVARGSEETSENVNTIATATEELAVAAQDVGSLVNRAGAMVSGAVAHVRQTDGTVALLGEGAEKIGDIIRLITKIAAQTNLLALNATIEAARAGEAGKGFAVVASEVKMLAVQTGRAAKEIDAQVKQIRAATTDAVEAIRIIGQIVAEVNTIALTIAFAVEQQQVATNGIARSIVETSRASQEVATNIGHVRQAATDTDNAANRALTSASKLAQGAHSLSREVEEFLQSVRSA